MVDMQAVAALLDEIINDDTHIEPGGDNFGGFHSRPTGGVLISRRDRVLMEEIADIIRRDPMISENVGHEDVHEEVVTAVVDGTNAREAGIFVAHRLAKELVDRILAGFEPWRVLWPVAGIALPAGELLEVGGLTIGRLTAVQLAEVREGQRAIGMTVRLGPDGAPGSALPYIMEDTEQVLASSEYWALGVVEGRRASIKWIMEERVRVALDVLRVFGLYVGIDPDKSRLGDLREAAIRRTLFYNSNLGSFSSHSLDDVRFPYELEAARLQRLRDDPLFQRAQAIAALASPNELQRKIVLAMMQFGSASRIATAEEKISGYLTVVESLLARDSGENDKKRWKRAARRLALFLTSTPAHQREIVEMFTGLYNVRRYPVHFGERALRGRQVVLPAHVRQARELAYFAILLALDQGHGLTMCDELIDKLDAELTSRGMVPGRPPAVDDPTPI